MVNLLNNAADAVSFLDEKWVKIEIQEMNGKIEILVTDSGQGIPEEIREKILEPFFTTKEIGEGTGIGLSISQNIIRNHSGSLSVNSDCKNTQFIIKLPKKHIGKPSDE